MKIARNAPCPCGSGKKYKNCCRNKSAAMPLSQKLLIALLGFILVGGLMIGIATMKSSDGHMGLDAGKGRVWSDEHQHWH
jgi:hypothetical protein